MKRTILIMMLVVVAASVGGIIGAYFVLRYTNLSEPDYSSVEQRQQMVLAGYKSDTVYRVPAEMDFLSTSQSVTSAVVHIQTSYGPGDFSINPLQFFEGQSRSSGSGVILTDDGYVVTNNHVIEEATSIEVVMNNNQRYFAKLIGADPTTDLALLKIKGRNFPFLRYGDSDRIRPGEWVLAVGNPFDLNSTVTAGIVSAKARNIGILRDRNNLQVESFIQTDAAVNPGNSGGALVNLKGELIGVNSAIATSSGGYQGYSFAIPVSLVKKVVDDLLEYGQVQRGLLGIQITDVNARVADELGLSISQGVLVNRVNEGSAAIKAGIEEGDVITIINKRSVASVSELQELVARHRPGTEIEVTYLRDDKLTTVSAVLKNSQGDETVSEREVQYEIKGVSLEDVPYKELNSMQLEGGARITSLTSGKWKEAGLKPGFVICYIDKVPVENVKDLNRILDYKRGGILIEGFYSDGTKGTYGVEW